VFNIGPTEVLVILAIALLVVGPKRLPELGKTVGKSMREFRRAQEELKSSFDLSAMDEPATKPAAKPSQPAGATVKRTDPDPAEPPAEPAAAADDPEPDQDPTEAQ
jgi:TatA/E family protein of Tat protein translocase